MSIKLKNEAKAKRLKHFVLFNKSLILIFYNTTFNEWFILSNCVKIITKHSEKKLFEQIKNKLTPIMICHKIIKLNFIDMQH